MGTTTLPDRLTFTGDDDAPRREARGARSREAFEVQPLPMNATDGVRLKTDPLTTSASRAQAEKR